METYHKIQTLFKRDMDGSLTGKKGKMIRGAWTTPELEYLADNEWEFTEKVDGTNIRIGSDGHGNIIFGGRTSNASLPAPLANYLHETFTSDLFGKAGLVGEVTLYGEGYGPKIQNGGNYRDDQSFVLFDVKIGHWWLKRDDVDEIAESLGIDSVPVIGYGTLNDSMHIVSGWSYRESDLGELITVPPMRSTWGDFEAEGIVARPKVAMFDRKGERIITKIKCVDFR